MARSASRRLASILLVTALCGLGGCVHRLETVREPQAPLHSPSATLIQDLAARNLVFTLAQIHGLHPMDTTVRRLDTSPDTSDAFYRAVLTRVIDAGYGLQRVFQHTDRLLLDAFHEPGSTSGEIRYRVSIGEVSVTRTYRHDGQHFYPVSEQQVRGAADQAVLINDELFGIDLPPDISGVSFFAPDDGVVADLSSEHYGSFLEAEQRFATLVRQNLHDTLRSNYAPLFAGYRDVRQETLVFGNDSMMMGLSGKRVVRDLVDQFDPTTDLISVIGCSHGRTVAAGGNEALATGRADRTKEELIFGGIAHDKVLEEGCWAPTPFDEVLPRRGVLVTLKRRQASP